MRHARSDVREGGFCATLFKAVRNSLILNGEMSEWSIEHAWKSTLLARADAHEIPPTHSRSTTSPNIDTRRHVFVNHGVHRGFEGVCDTVLTQRRETLRATSIETYMRVRLTTLEFLHGSLSYGSTVSVFKR